MLYDSKTIEEEAVLEAARRMCAAARTAPKAKGRDILITLVLTGQEKSDLADMMIKTYKDSGDERISFFERDAENIRNAGALVLIGVKKAVAGLVHCGYCGFEDCGECTRAGAQCVFSALDLGIAIGSAVSVAADARVDNRIMYSVGTVAAKMPYCQDGTMWHGIPISIASKNLFFDRKRKKQ